MSTTPTGIPVIDCETCGKSHPSTREHCPVCGLATLFGHGNCEAPDNPRCVCGHTARVHHGQDGRERPDAGCMVTGVLSVDWCHCRNTCARVVAGSLDNLTLFEVTP